MKDDDITRRIYEIRLLQTDLQKDQEERWLGEDVRVSPSGVLEFNQIYTDSDDKRKVFFKGEFLVTEMPLSEYQEIRNMSDHECDHDHGDEE
jgi:hypothetical protein